MLSRVATSGSTQSVCRDQQALQDVFAWLETNAGGWQQVGPSLEKRHIDAWCDLQTVKFAFKQLREGRLPAQQVQHAGGGMPAERVLPTDLRLEVSSGMLKSISRTVLEVRWLLLSWVAARDAEMTLLTDLHSMGRAEVDALRVTAKTPRRSTGLPKCSL